MLNLETLRNKVPSIFTGDRAGRTSAKYQHISTENVIMSLMGEGFIPTWAAQCNCRIAVNKAYTKHMLRFRHINARPTQSGLYPEVVLINSHNGQSSYRLMSGIYRTICSNGLIAGASYDDIRIRHQGNIISDVIEGTYKIIENSHNMINAASKMTAIYLDDNEKQLFLEEAHYIRFGDSQIGNEFLPAKLLQYRRSIDMEQNDLFTLFNVIQENLMKGGIRGYSRDEKGYIKRSSTRAIKSIDQNIIINRKLWSLAEKFMQAHS